MRTLVAVTLLAGLAAAAPAQAQPDPLAATLDVAVPYLTGEGSDGILYGGSGTLEAPWTLSFADPAAAAAQLASGNGTITWALTCPEPITMPPATTPIAVMAGQGTYSGTASFTLQADPAAQGAHAIPCQLTAVFTGASTSSQDTVEAAIVVEYHASINATAEQPTRTGGPQKMIRYPIVVTNNGNARTVVTFSLAEGLPGKWNAIVPDPVVLEPGESGTAILTVATPYKNGYNKATTGITLVASPSAADDPEKTGAPVTVGLKANVDGLYIPGPGIPLLALALVVAAIVRPRRT